MEDAHVHKERERVPEEPVLVVVEGLDGVGKTTLAVALAHALSKVVPFSFVRLYCIAAFFILRHWVSMRYMPRPLIPPSPRSEHFLMRNRRIAEEPFISLQITLLLMEYQPQKLWYWIVFGPLLWPMQWVKQLFAQL